MPPTPTLKYFLPKILRHRSSGINLSRRTGTTSARRTAARRPRTPSTRAPSLAASVRIGANVRADERVTARCYDGGRAVGCTCDLTGARRAASSTNRRGCECPPGTFKSATGPALRAVPRPARPRAARPCAAGTLVLVDGFCRQCGRAGAYVLGCNVRRGGQHDRGDARDRKATFVSVLTRRSSIHVRKTTSPGGALLRQRRGTATVSATPTPTARCACFARNITFAIKKC